MSLVIKNLTFQYSKSNQSKDVLRDLSMDVRKGELVAVIGPSGSGKSTLLKLISGLSNGATGSIFLNGEDLSGKPVHQRNIGFVFQNYALFPHLSVIDNIAYGLKIRGVDLVPRHKKANELLALVGMSEFAKQNVQRLSGGQQQRVALARALAVDPQALLLDEPLAALDANIRGYLRDQIKLIQRQFNATTLLVTHDQEEALAMADRVAILKDGELLQFASPQDIYQQPRNKAVAQFVGLSTILPAIISASDEIDLGFAKLKTNIGNRQIGDQVFALIRPESFVPDAPLNEPHSTNRLLGQSTTERYLGAVCRYDFQVTGWPVTVLAESPQAARASLSIDPEKICLLDD
jgi:putative spermidine/putrescine transport system ATP-binding protein